MTMANHDGSRTYTPETYKFKPGQLVTHICRPNGPFARVVSHHNETVVVTHANGREQMG